jgi:hypothetical protein
MELFISRGDHSSAHRLHDSLRPALQTSQGTLKNRFLQLNGLLLSREGRLDEARAILEPTFVARKEEHPERIEDEAAGILAGIYKRIWTRDGDLEFLEKSHETYRWGWRRSGNVYLGINAATTALWLKNPDEAKGIAVEVKSILEERRILIQRSSGRKYDLNYWDLTTLAEAELLLKNVGSSAELYRAAFSRHGDQAENITLTKKQLVRLIDTLSLPADSNLEYLSIIRF